MCEKRSSLEVEPWLVATPYTTESVHERRSLVRITRMGICASDRRCIRGTKSSLVFQRNGLTLGHEVGGYIVEVADGEGELHVGDKVVVLPHRTCGQCDACQSNRPNLCMDLQHLGFHMDGTYASHCYFPSGMLAVVGAEFPDDSLPLVEPLACVLHSLQRSHVIDRLKCLRPSAIVTVFGAGPMGSLIACSIRHFYPESKVQMVEPNPIRRSIVEALGICDHVLEQPCLCGPSDLTFVATSTVAACQEAIEATSHDGTVVLFSGLNTDELQRWGQTDAERREAEEWEKIHRREGMHEQDSGPMLVGSSGYHMGDIRQAIRLLVEYPQDFVAIQNVVVEGLTSRSANYLRPMPEIVRLIVLQSKPFWLPMVFSVRDMGNR